jgi:hypothetical protein
LSSINPEQGGSPTKYQDFLNSNREFKTTLSLERGNLVHLYCEHPEEFIVSDVVKPSDISARWAEQVYKTYTSEIDLETHILNIRDKFQFHKNIKDKVKALEKWNKESESYYQFLKVADGKIAMDPATHHIVTNCIKSLHAHEKADQLLFHKEDFSNVEYFNELEIYWKEAIEIEFRGRRFMVEVPCKAKLDRVIVDHDKKFIKIPDIKTTSVAVSQFQQSFQYYRYYRQHKFYRRALYMYLKDKIKDIGSYTVDSYNIVVETVNRFEVAIFPISQFWLLEGAREVTSLLGRIAWHMNTNIWNMTMEEYNNNGYTYLKDEYIK